MGTGRIRVFVLKIPIYRIINPDRFLMVCRGYLFVYCGAIMPFWTVGDAGPYKEKSNFLMRRPLYGHFCFFGNSTVKTVMPFPLLTETQPL